MSPATPDRLGLYVRPYVTSTASARAAARVVMGTVVPGGTENPMSGAGVELLSHAQVTTLILRPRSAREAGASATE